MYSQAIHLWRDLCGPDGGKPPPLSEQEETVLRLKAVAARWRQVLRLGSTAEMRESKTEHLLAGLARTGGKSHAPPDAPNPRRWQVAPSIYMSQESMEDGKRRVHPLERLLLPELRADDDEDEGW